MNTKSIVIVGSNPTGTQIARRLADSGIKVHLVEASPFLMKGGNGSQPTFENQTTQLELAQNPNVTIWTDTEISLIQKTGTDLKVELHQRPRFVDLERCTACEKCLVVCPVTVPGTNHKAIYQDGQPGCMVIEKEGVSPCANTCPGGIQVQGYIALIAQGRFQEAIDLIRQAIPFPGICGRVCTHPCEVNCRRKEIDEPVAVRLLKRFVADWALTQPDSNNKKTKTARNFANNKIPPDAQKVAVIGAGPGGMAVANDLSKKGYQVSVFDQLPVVGGMMAAGIPRYRLPREVIDREYQYVLDQGIDLQLSTPIGPEGKHSLDDLTNMGYQAICLAIGAHRSQSLDIPGENLPGVLHGIDVLKKINIDRDESSFLPKGKDSRIAIIGGGNTAIDVSRSLKRLGIDQVRVLYRRTRQEMPAMAAEVEDAIQEGVRLEFLLSPTRFLGDEQRGISGIECVRMQLGEPDTSGRRRPIAIAGSAFVLNLDLVILAIGQNPNLDFLDPDHKITFTRQQRINIRETDFMTSQPGIFAVGDAVTRDKMAVIEAIGMGKQAADGIDTYLKGLEINTKSLDRRQTPVSKRRLSETDRTSKPRTPVPTIAMTARQTSFEEVETGYSAEQAVAEANRCLFCGPCSDCQACVQVCESQAIHLDQADCHVEIDAWKVIYTEKTNGDKEHLAQLWDRDQDEGSTHLSGEVLVIPSDDHKTTTAFVFHALQSLLSGNSNPAPKTIMPGFQRGRESTLAESGALPVIHKPDRCALFICQCGLENSGEISSVIDTKALASLAATWPGVVHTNVLPFSCTEDGARTIENAIVHNDLNRIVVAGCSCCSFDQICYSCTYQRVRCKQNLHIFSEPERSSALGAAKATSKFVFINIREQCAWIHRDDPKTATSKAAALIAGAMARVMSSPRKIPRYPKITRSTLILGGGADPELASWLESYSIKVHLEEHVPEKIIRSRGQFNTVTKEHTYQTATLILAPKNEAESVALLAAFEQPCQEPVDTDSQSEHEQSNGAFLIRPSLDPSLTKMTATTRIVDWFNHLSNTPHPASIIDPSRCRTCGTCVEICEFGAPEIVPYENQHASWIDPVLCRGCGTCAAHCPSGAITAGYSTEAQIDAMLSAVLSRPTQ